jgi:hypothetical protein
MVIIIATKTHWNTTIPQEINLLWNSIMDTYGSKNTPKIRIFLQFNENIVMVKEILVSNSART